MNVQTEEKLVKITEVGEYLCKGTAEGMEWKVKPLLSAGVSTLQVGSVINCYVLYDNEDDEFYLKQKTLEQSFTEYDWKKQEGLYNTKEVKVVDVTAEKYDHSSFYAGGGRTETVYHLNFSDTRIVLSTEQIEQIVSDYHKEIG